MLGMCEGVVGLARFERVVLPLQLRDFRFQPGVFRFDGLGHWFFAGPYAYLRCSGSLRSDGPS